MTITIDSDRVRVSADDVIRIRDSFDRVGLRVDAHSVTTGPTASAARDTVPVRLGPGKIVVGPISSGSGPCSTCLHLRSTALRSSEEQSAIDAGTPAAVLGHDGRVSDSVVLHLRSLAASLLATAGDGRVFEVDTASLATRSIELISHSDCPVCAEPPVDAPEAVYQPRSVVKRATNDHRGRDLEDFDLRPEALVNDVCGVIGGQRYTVYQCTATLPVSGYFRVRSRFAYHEMWWSGQNRSRASSTAAGLLEGLERYAGQYPRARRTAVSSSSRALGATAVDPRGFGAYSDRFHTAHAASYVRFSDDLEMPWVWAYSFARSGAILVPEQLAYYLDRTPAPKFVQECSSGCATGSSRDEAVLHGLLELIERDSFLLTWGSGTALPEIDADRVTTPDIRFVLDRLERIGYRVRFFDLRVDIPVPAVLAVGERVDGGIGRLCFAAGASFDPVDAMRAALSEVASYVPGLDERTEARLPELRTMVEDWTRVTELTHHALLYGLPEMRPLASFILDSGQAPITIEDLYADWEAVRPRSLDLADDVRFLVDAVAAVGGDVFVVDQTTPEQETVGAATVAVLSDGLIPIDFGWDRQRLHGHRRLHAHLEGRLADRAAACRSIPVPRAANLAPHPFP